MIWTMLIFTNHDNLLQMLVYYASNYIIPDLVSTVNVSYFKWGGVGWGGSGCVIGAKIIVPGGRSVLLSLWC